MIALRGMLMGAVFPLTGFSEMPKGGSVPQQPIQQPGQQQSAPQPRLSATSIPPEFIPRLHNISHDQLAMFRAMQTRLAGGTNPVAQQHQQIPSGISLEVMQALMQRKQDGSG